MADTVKNKALVARFFEVFSNGDFPGVIDMLDNEASWLVYGKLESMSGRYGKAEMAAMLPGTKALYKAPLRITPTEMIAEGDRVAAEAVGYAELLDGRVYDPPYIFLFRIRDGKMLEVKEFLDTHFAVELFFPG